MKIYQIWNWDDNIKRYYPMPAFPVATTKERAEWVIQQLKANPKNAKHKFIYTEYDVHKETNDDQIDHAGL